MHKTAFTIFFGEYTKFNIVCTTRKINAYKINVLTAIIRCLMHLTRKPRINFEVNEISDQLYL